jgi:hypothetical protein
MNKYGPILIVLAFLLMNYCSTEETIISKRNQAILPDTLEPKLFDCDSLWLPTISETNDALHAIQLYLQNKLINDSISEFERSEIKQILENLSKYKVQFVGIYNNNEILIHCNFFPKSLSDIRNWKHETVFVLDGGFWFWRIVYNVKNGKCIKFRSNGYA